eukprot:2325285-Heterocapsa_arctica.AAC.1
MRSRLPKRALSPQTCWMHMPVCPAVRRRGKKADMALKTLPALLPSDRGRMSPSRNSILCSPVAK